MKVKIIRVQVGQQAYYEVLFKKAWYSRWKKLEMYYKSPFEEMHGWWSACFPTYEDAADALNNFLLGNFKISNDTIYEKEI